jgi:hypothetical protein
MVDEPERAPHVMIASASQLASQAGLFILRKAGTMPQLWSRSRWRAFIPRPGTWAAADTCSSVWRTEGAVQSTTRKLHLRRRIAAHSAMTICVPYDAISGAGKSRIGLTLVRSSFAGFRYHPELGLSGDHQYRRRAWSHRLRCRGRTAVSRLHDQSNTALAGRCACGDD